MTCSGNQRNNRDRKNARAMRDFHNFHKKSFNGEIFRP